jgi:hypothetical protein
MIENALPLRGGGRMTDAPGLLATSEKMPQLKKTKVNPLLKKKSSHWFHHNRASTTRIRGFFHFEFGKAKNCRTTKSHDLGAAINRCRCGSAGPGGILTAQKMSRFPNDVPPSLLQTLFIPVHWLSSGIYFESCVSIMMCLFL